ncbi:DNA ligase [Desulfobacterium sp. N47]|uniref:DNA ligase n=1 Tax=Desulfobacterium sp. N47 TaxID=3115210 RepID=UPI003CA90B4A
MAKLTSPPTSSKTRKPRVLQSAFVSVLAVVLLSCSIASADPPALQHAGTYTGREPVAGWLMSEKLDGIRGYWTGKELVTRKGYRIHAPGWFTKHFPPFALDGELWRGRNDFAFVQRTVLDEVPSENWKEITYNIFEAPEAAGDFLSRLQKATTWFKAHPAPHVRTIKQTPCRGPDHLDAFLKKIESLGGEGVIIKNPALPFHAGRSPHILKVKNFSDMEGTVIAHTPGKGKFEGMMGSITLRLENGIEFKLGTGFTIADRKHPPPVDAVVTFKYQDLTPKDIPRFASFMRVRRD